MLVAYTCGGQMSEGRAYTLVAYTCGGQMSKGHAYTLVAYTCGGQMSEGRAYSLVAYMCGGQMYKGRAYTLITYTYSVSKCLLCEKTCSLGDFRHHCKPLGPFIEPIIIANYLLNGENAHF